MTASGRTPVGDPSSHPVRDSELGLPRTYGRTDGEELVKREQSPTFRNARDDRKNPCLSLWSKRNTASFPMPLSRRVARGGIDKGMKWEN